MEVNLRQNIDHTKKYIINFILKQLQFAQKKIKRNKWAPSVLKVTGESKSPALTESRVNKPEILVVDKID